MDNTSNINSKNINLNISNNISDIQINNLIESEKEESSKGNIIVNKSINTSELNWENKKEEENSEKEEEEEEGEEEEEEESISKSIEKIKNSLHSSASLEGNSIISNEENEIKTLKLKKKKNQKKKIK